MSKPPIVTVDVYVITTGKLTLTKKGRAKIAAGLSREERRLLVTLGKHRGPCAILNIEREIAKTMPELVDVTHMMGGWFGELTNLGREIAGDHS